MNLTRRFRKFLGIEESVRDGDLDRRASETQEQITQARQQLRQNIQRSESRSRLMSQWDDAMVMMREKK